MKFQDFPAHSYGLSLSHNPHKDQAQSVEQWEADLGVAEDAWISLEQRAKAIETNDFWTLDWTTDPEDPDTALAMAGADLDALLAAAKAAT